MKQTNLMKNIAACVEGQSEFQDALMESLRPYIVTIQMLLKRLELKYKPNPNGVSATDEQIRKLVAPLTNNDTTFSVQDTSAKALSKIAPLQTFLNHYLLHRTYVLQ